MAVELLSQATGYGVIIGLSFLFCLVILVCVNLQKRYLSEDSEQSEMVRMLGLVEISCRRKLMSYTIVHGRQQICRYGSDMFGCLLQLDVDQRERILCRLYVQMGCCVADLVGEWAFIPDRFDGCHGHCGKVTGTGMRFESTCFVCKRLTEDSTPTLALSLCVDDTETMST